MDSSDILYFDHKSNEGITLNLNFVGRFLWYTDIEGPVTFTFLPHDRFNIIYKKFLLEFNERSVTIYSDCKRKKVSSPPTSLTSFEISKEDLKTIRNGIINLLESYPKKTVGKKIYLFDPFVMKIHCG